MSKQKPQRWYEIVGDTAYVYDVPFSSMARSVSIVPVSDLAYYRCHFALTKIWGIASPLQRTMNEGLRHATDL